MDHSSGAAHYVADWVSGEHQNFGVSFHAPGTQQEHNGFRTIYDDGGLEPELIIQFNDFLM